MDASDAHCRPCPRSRLSWCCALFGCSSRERARGGNSSERVWELGGRCVELLACLLAVSKVSGSTSAVQPRLVPKEEGSSSQVSQSFFLSVCLFVCLCLPCLLEHLRMLCLSLSLLVHVSLFCLDEFLPIPSPLTPRSSRIHTLPLTVVQLEPTVQVPVPLGPIKCSVWVQRWTGRDYDFSGALDF